MVSLDDTLNASRTSWVASANGHLEFPIQNLPFGIFRPGGEPARPGVAIGDNIFDIEIALDGGLFSGPAKEAATSALGDKLNGLLALPSNFRRALRLRLFELLASDTEDGLKAKTAEARLLHAMSDCAVLLPAHIGGYSDFFCSVQHATNAGRIFRGGSEPLTRNYKHVPIGYNGRASSIVASETPIRRPLGQRLDGDVGVPAYGPSQRLDYELELGVWVGLGNELGLPIPIAEADEHIAGFCLLNDWSARDLQVWEAQPLGPFLSKSFSTSISPWIVTVEALAPFRCARSPREACDPQPLPYLSDRNDEQRVALNIELEVYLSSTEMRRRGLRPRRLSRANARELYWSVVQMVTHHTSNGCNLWAGDLLGTGTISSTDTNGRGCLLEATEGGRVPFILPSGEHRTYLEDGDEVVFVAHARRDGFATIGFGQCRGIVLPALTPFAPQ